jgi:hypothetical protein
MPENGIGVARGFGWARSCCVVLLTKLEGRIREDRFSSSDLRGSPKRRAGPGPVLLYLQVWQGNRSESDENLRMTEGEKAVGFTSASESRGARSRRSPGFWGNEVAFGLSG